MSEPGAWRSGGARDVGLERRGLQLDFVEAVLDHVADADEARQLAVAEHGKVADAPLGHERHQIRDPVLRTAGDYGLGHELFNAALERRRAVRAEGMNDVP